MLYAPTATPAAVLERLREAFSQLYRQADFTARLAAQGMEGRPMAPAELDAFLRGELPKWAKLVKDSGARID